MVANRSDTNTGVALVTDNQIRCPRQELERKTVNIQAFVIEGNASVPRLVLVLVRRGRTRPAVGALNRGR